MENFKYGHILSSLKRGKMILTKNHVIILLVLIVSLGLFMAINPQISGFVTAQYYQCGDGKCTVPYEDEIQCPQDCTPKLNKTPWIIAIILLFILLFMYINYYRGMLNLRQITRGKIPFKSEQELNTIVSFIEKSLNKFDKKEIIPKLLKKGWSPKQVRFAFEELAWKKQRKILSIKKNIPVKSNNIKPLDQYIKKCLSARMSKDRIKSNLLLKGWKRATVEEALKKYT